MGPVSIYETTITCSLAAFNYAPEIPTDDMRATKRAERQLIVAPLVVRLNNRPSGTALVGLLLKLYCGKGRKKKNQQKSSCGCLSMCRLNHKARTE